MDRTLPCGGRNAGSIPAKRIPKIKSAVGAFYFVFWMKRASRDFFRSAAPLLIVCSLAALS